MFVDIGGDSAGFLPFTLAVQTEASLGIGESVEVILAGEAPEGGPLLSSLSVQKPRSWDQLEAAFNAGIPVLGEVLGTTKGGLAVDVGVWAFMPTSRSGVQSKREMESLVGTRVQARIHEFDRTDRNVVLDRSCVVDADRTSIRETTLARLKIGDRIRGKIQTVRDFGAFVDLGGIDGLLRARDIAWQRVRDPGDFLRIGEEVEVEILRIDLSKERIGVGLKQLHPRPAGDPAGPANSMAEAAGQPADPVQGSLASKWRKGVSGGTSGDPEAFQPDALAGSPTESPVTGDIAGDAATGESPGDQPRSSDPGALRPQGWRDLESAYNSGTTVLGTVAETIKGGLSVDVGVRAFLPASRSGARSTAELEALVGQQIRARIREFDRVDRNVVLDRRSVLREERTEQHQEAIDRFNVGDRVSGRVQKVVSFGAFVDLGGIDGLLHVKDIAWQHVGDPADFVSPGQEIEVEILRLDRDKNRVRVGMKQLEREPWAAMSDQVKVNSRIRGTVTQVKEFGAFIEISPGVEGLLHVADMSPTRYVKHPSEIVSAGNVVEVIVMDVNIAQKRVRLRLASGPTGPWQQLGNLYEVGSTVSATVRKVTGFGAFVEVLDGVEGLLRVSDIASERVFNTPSEVLRRGQQLRVKILELDVKRKRLKVGMRQVEPTDASTLLPQIGVGEIVKGRVVELDDYEAIVEIRNGLRGICALTPAMVYGKRPAPGSIWGRLSLRAMLRSALKKDSGALEDEPVVAPLTKGSVHAFEVRRLDAAKGTVHLART